MISSLFRFRREIIKNTYLTITIIILIAVFIVAGVLYIKILEHNRDELKGKLLITATSLYIALEESVENPINTAELYNGTNKEKILHLNSLLQPIVNDLSETNPNLGIGYYDLRLDSVITPEPNFNTDLLKPIPRDYPYFVVLQTGKPEIVDSNTSFTWDGKGIISANIPFYADGKIVGLVWANIKSGDIYFNAAKEALIVLIGGVLIWGIALYFI